MKPMYDLIILGGGPAGVASAAAIPIIGWTLAPSAGAMDYAAAATFATLSVAKEGDLSVEKDGDMYIKERA